MEKTAADFVVITALQTLTNLITQEAVLLEGVRDKVEQLRDDLRWMQSFLKDVDAEQGKSERFRTWVSQIREVACNAEDVIETYITKAASQSSWNLAAKWINLHKVGKKIANIQSRIDNISRQKEHFGITSVSREGCEGMIASPDEMIRWWRQTPPNIEEEDLVGLEEDTKALLTQLTLMEPGRCVISIVGMGGLGKTTLAKRLYNHTDIRNQFDCKAFIYVSKEYTRRDTLQKIIVAVSPSNIDDLKKLEEEDLVSRLHELLKEKRYLVVLDDIWERKVWYSLKAAFPSGKIGSKVMLTTRKREVALHADAMRKPFELRFLTQDESLKLLLMKTFPGLNHLPSDLENFGKEMVAKCDGLPLAVVVLGGLLSSKMKTPEEWRHVLQNISSRLTNEGPVYAILALSYSDLPFNLKSCFLHLGIFPEDYSIPKTKLMQLWFAERFLPQPQGEETIEDVADNCLNELIDRCMIQVETRTSFAGRVKTIRIHDLLRDLSVSKGKEENFLEIFSGHKVESSASQSTKFRRLAIHTASDEYAFLKSYGPHLRSLQFFSIEEYDKIDIVFKSFKLLRVLLGAMPCKAVGNLTQLRYLELCSGNIPRSIGNLKNLQTLNLSRNYSIHHPIPNVIWKMKHLKHLYLSYNLRSQNLRLHTLSHLQTLKKIEGGRWIGDGGLASMISLRRLRIWKLSRENVNLVISIIGDRLPHVQSLSLSVGMTIEDSFPTPMIGLSHCEHLQKIHLNGKIIEKQLPDPHKFPPNLVKLSLEFTNLQQDSIDKLGRLPNLKMLVLGVRSIQETKLVCSSLGFPQLHILQLEYLDDLEELIAEDRAIPKLKNLKITSCPRLKNIIPEELMLITTW